MKRGEYVSKEINSDFPDVIMEHDDLELLLEFLSGYIQDLRISESSGIANFDTLTTQSIQNKAYGKELEKIVLSHGWTSLHGWLTPFADFDSVLRSLGNFYFSL